MYDMMLTFLILFSEFVHHRFNGSTLQIQGTSEINGEWSIVGGTGELTMAKGTVKRIEISYTGTTRISELNIHVFYTPTKPTSVSITHLIFNIVGIHFPI
jgi:hypothetical protein